MSVIRIKPCVFAVGDTYQIFVPVSCQTLMWVRIGDECYYDHSNGIIKSAVSVHKITVPCEELDREKKYTVCYRKIIDRKPYFPETEDTVEESFEFYPVSGDTIRAYQVADAHNMVDAPVKAAETFEKEYGKIDFLILNGDVPDHSGKIENFDNIYQICDKITHGNIPVVFSRGNHDTRGIFAENFADYTPCDNGKSYYYVKLGAFFGIIMDCGEDKPDTSAEYGHTICCHAFRKAETKYLEKLAENKNEYIADDVKYKVVIAHVPFTQRFAPPFNIEEDIYTKWAKILKDEIKPDVMLCGHMHKLYVSRPGSEKDVLGQPCTVVVGSLPRVSEEYFAGTGICFSPDGIRTVFTDSDGKILSEEKI